MVDAHRDPAEALPIWEIFATQGNREVAFSLLTRAMVVVMGRILTVIGTRPEAIKMAPVLLALDAAPEMRSILCVTGQHRDMLDAALDEFGLAPDHDLNIMRPGQDLAWITTAVLEGVGRALAAERPDWLLVHGDTTTAMAAAMAGFYAGVPVAHVEAGLRSGDMTSPFPEEFNRVTVDRVASLLFAPTPGARDNLLREGHAPDRIEVTGNTAVDALLATRARLDRDSALRARCAAALPKAGRIILVTGHRRENFGAPFEAICRALARLARRGDVAVVYPVHLNPAVREPAHRILGGVPGVHLLPALGHAAFTHLLGQAALVLTDSGGIQEEAPSLGVPVLVMRDVTERPEAMAAGTARLVGTDEDAIVAAATAVLDSPPRRAPNNPYGDGRAAERILARLRLEIRRSSAAPAPRHGPSAAAE